MKVKEKKNKEKGKSASSNGAGSNGTLRHIDLDLIIDHPKVPYRKLKPDHLASIKKSIQRSGLDTPLQVWDGGDPSNKVEIEGLEGRHPATFRIAGGHRREALKQIRKEDKAWFKAHFPDGVPAVVRTGSLKEAISALVRENVQRDDPDPSELLPQVKYLSKKLGMKNVEIARAVGKSKSWVTTILDIGEQLGGKVEKAVGEGKIGLQDAVDAAQKAKRNSKKGGKVDRKKIAAELKAKKKERGSKSSKRGAKRVSASVLHKRYTGLPSMSASKKLPIAEAILAYLADASNDLPKQVTTTDKD